MTSLDGPPRPPGVGQGGGPDRRRDRPGVLVTSCSRQWRRCPRTELSDALEQLVDSELVFRRGEPPDATYTFKHALVQEAAYQSLLKPKRQQLHARIAKVLEERLTDAGEAGQEVLAQHWTNAGLAERAIPYWRRAGERAARRSANLEAIAHLNKGLELLGTLPDASEHLDEEFALRMAIGGPLIATKGYPAPEVEQTYSRAWALCDQPGRSAELFPVLRGLWNCYLNRGELHRAHDLAERLVALAEEQGTPVHRALARRALGTTLFFLGRFGDAAAALSEGIAIDDAVAAWEDPAHLLLYTERAGVVCRLYSAWVLWYLGFPDGALQKIEDGLALGHRLAHVNSLTFALNWAAVLHNLRREFDAAHRRAAEAIEIASEYGLSQWLAEAIVCRGFALVGLGQQAQGIAQLQYWPSRLERRPVPACSIPSGLASSRRPTFRPVSSTTRSLRWIGRPKPPRPPASATIKRSCTG